MSSSKKTKKLNSHTSSLSRYLVIPSLCFLTVGHYGSSTYATEQDRLANTSSRKRINTASDEGAPLLVSASDMEAGTSRIKTIPVLQREINETLSEPIKDDPLPPRVDPLDAGPAENGMNQVTRAFEYSLEEDFRKDIESELTQEGTVKPTFEENQQFLLQQGLDAATTGPLSRILASLVDQTRELQQQKAACVAQIKKLRDQCAQQRRVLQDTAPVLTKVQEHISSLLNLNTKFKIALGVSIPLAFAAGGGALYLFLHYWGR